MSQWGATPAVPSSQQQMPRVVEDLQIWVREGGGVALQPDLIMLPERWLNMKASFQTYELIVHQRKEMLTPKRSETTQKYNVQP